MTESEKDQEIARLRERCALLDSLLGECLRHQYYDEAAVSRFYPGNLCRSRSTAQVGRTHSASQW